MTVPESVAQGKEAWESMSIEYVGHVAEILQQGEPGKDPTSTGDPGEPLKVPSIDR